MIARPLWRVLFLCSLIVALTSAGCAAEDESTETPADAIGERTPPALAVETGLLTPSPTPTARPSRTPSRSATPRATTTTPFPAITLTPTPSDLQNDVTGARETQVTPRRTARPTATVTPVTAAALRRALIDIEDLASPEWQSTEQNALGGVEEADAETTIFLCHELLRRRVLAVENNFERGRTGPFLTHQIAMYPPGEAEAAMAAFAAAAEACDAVNLTLAGGSASSLTVSPLSFPRLGDGTLAVHLRGESIPFVGRPRMNVVKIRHGNIIITVGHFNIGELSAEQTAVVGRFALRKLKDILEE